jgi:hypothetical protein
MKLSVDEVADALHLQLVGSPTFMPPRENNCEFLLMTAQELALAKDKDLVASLQAIKRAAELARKQAIQTGTEIVIMRDEQIVHVSAEQLKQEGRL